MTTTTTHTRNLTVPLVITETSDEIWERTQQFNAAAVFYGIRAALRVMVPRGQGKIITTASLAGLAGSQRVSAYAAAKAAVIALTRNAAVEFAHTGVRINAIAPGSMETTGLEPWMASLNLDVSAWIGRIPQNRLGRAEDIAGAALFLASDALVPEWRDDVGRRRSLRQGRRAACGGCQENLTTWRNGPEPPPGTLARRFSGC